MKDNKIPNTKENITKENPQMKVQETGKLEKQ